MCIVRMTLSVDFLPGFSDMRSSCDLRLNGTTEPVEEPCSLGRDRGFLGAGVDAPPFGSAHRDRRDRHGRPHQTTSRRYRALSVHMHGVRNARPL